MLPKKVVIFFSYLSQEILAVRNLKDIKKIRKKSFKSDPTEEKELKRSKAEEVFTKCNHSIQVFFRRQEKILLN